MEALPGKRDLGVHSLLVDHMLPLIESGVITNSRKRLHPGRMDVGEIMGTERLFRWVHDNPMVNMEPSDIVHDPQVVGALGDFVSVNSALEVDLLGQVNAESVDGRQITGIGGQFDFVLGASRAAGGTVHHRPALDGTAGEGVAHRGEADRRGRGSLPRASSPTTW
jgi:4-hydroxybutyrate CoA-transferase